MRLATHILRLMKRTVDDLVDTEMFLCVNEIIFQKLMVEISNYRIDVGMITSMVEKGQ